MTGLSTLRPARREEVAQLAAIGLKAWQKGIMPLVPDTVRDRVLQDNPFFPFLEKLGPAVLVGEYRGTPAGIGACEHGDDHISDLWVDPAYEGLGIGSALLRALEMQIADQGYERVTIHVAAENRRALGLYRHFGFRVDWQETRFDPVLETDMEKVGLSKLIEPRPNQDTDL